MKEWHEKQVVKFQQSCSGVIEDQEDSLWKNLNADYSNFVQRGVDFSGQLFKKTPPNVDIFPENSDENVLEHFLQIVHLLLKSQRKRKT